MRNISFALTTPQFYRRKKTVTRRMGWANLRPGDLLCGVQQCQGLRPGQKIKKLAVIRVASVQREPLKSISDEEVTREGFPGMSPREFVRMFCLSHESCKPSTDITRIEFQYIPGGRFVALGFCRVCGCSDFDACEPDLLGQTCRWVTDRGLLTNAPTTLCSRCAFVDRFGSQI